MFFKKDPVSPPFQFGSHIFRYLSETLEPPTPVKVIIESLGGLAKLKKVTRAEQLAFSSTGLVFWTRQPERTFNMVHVEYTFENRYFVQLLHECSELKKDQAHLVYCLAKRSGVSPISLEQTLHELIRRCETGQLNLSNVIIRSLRCNGLRL